MIPCCVCGDPVLGLEGQDTLLDTFYLLEEEEDEQVLAEEIFGECHQACLSSSGWGAFWASRKAHNFLDVRGYQLVFEGQDFILMRAPHRELTVMIRHDGVGYGFSDDQFARRERADGGYLIPVEHELNFDISDKIELVNSLVGSIERQGLVPLRTVVDRLGVGPRLLVPESLEGGILSPAESWDVGEARAGFFSLWAAYHIYVTNEIAEAAGTWVKSC